MAALLQTETRVSEFKLPPLINRTKELPASPRASAFWFRQTREERVVGFGHFFFFFLRGRQTRDATFAIRLAARALCANEFFMNRPQRFMSVHGEKERALQTGMDGLGRVHFGVLKSLCCVQSVQTPAAKGVEPGHHECLVHIFLSFSQA